MIDTRLKNAPLPDRLYGKRTPLTRPKRVGQQPGGRQECGARAGAILIPPPAGARVIHVSADPDDGGKGVVRDGSLERPMTSVQAALDVADLQRRQHLLQMIQQTLLMKPGCGKTSPIKHVLKHL